MGWPGVVLLMTLETVIFVIPSEAVMPFAGWLLIKDKGHGVEWIVPAALLGGLGSTIGAWVFYYAGAWGGRPLLERFGRFFFISAADLDKGDRFFQRWGNFAVFFGRMVPLVRSFVSVPAGVARMDIRAFTLYTFAGSTIWAGLLAAIGYHLGENYEEIRNWLGPADIIVAIGLVAFVAWYVVHQVRESWEGTRTSKPEA
jgi:membrane protein DedA with SNARE-associated domain